MDMLDLRTAFEMSPTSYTDIERKCIASYATDVVLTCMIFNVGYQTNAFRCRGVLCCVVVCGAS